MQTEQAIDPFFKVEVISKTLSPQQVIYAALRQDYSESFVCDELGFEDQYDGFEPALNDPFNSEALITKKSRQAALSRIY
jgi:hypothetical protein